jgi:hypothetical protein
MSRARLEQRSGRIKLERIARHELPADRLAYEIASGKPVLRRKPRKASGEIGLHSNVHFISFHAPHGDTLWGQRQPPWQRRRASA